MKRTLLLTITILAVGVFSACGDMPTSPTSTSTGLALRGIVTGYEGAALDAAIVEIIDGVNTGRKVVTDAQGRYNFADLQPGEMTLQASAADYSTATKSVMLTTETSLNLQLAVRLARIAIVGDTLTFVSQPDGTFSVQGHAVNTGDGCAAALVGTATLADGNQTTVATLTSTMASDQILRPGDSYICDFCCLTRDQAKAVATFNANFRWVTVSCP